MFPWPSVAPCRRPLQPGGELRPGPADRRSVHHQPRRAGLLWMPGRLQPTQQLRLDLQEPQRHRHHRGPPAGGALLQTGPGRRVPLPRLQQRYTEAERGPVHSGGGQLRNRWVTRWNVAVKGLGVRVTGSTLQNTASCQKQKRFMNYDYDIWYTEHLGG